MTGDLSPQPRDIRMSDAERQRVAELLQTAVAEGRLTLREYEERLGGVLAARTRREVEPYLSDLPGAEAALPVVSAPREVGELHATASTLKRGGRWQVPRRLVVRNRAGSVKLDFTEASIAHAVTEVQLDVLAGTTTLVLPAGASVCADDVIFTIGNLKVRGVPTEPVTGMGPHFVVTGLQRMGDLVIRHQRRFLRWRW